MVPKYTLLSDAYLRFEIEATGPDEARRLWQTWLENRLPFRVEDHVQVTVPHPEAAVVLHESNTPQSPRRAPTGD